MLILRDLGFLGLSHGDVSKINLNLVAFPRPEQPRCTRIARVSHQVPAHVGLGGRKDRLRWLKNKLGDRMTAGAVLHLGSAAGSLGDGIYALPVSALWDHRLLPQ